MEIFASYGMKVLKERGISVHGRINILMKEPSKEWGWNGHPVDTSTMGSSRTIRETGSE